LVEKVTISGMVPFKISFARGCLGRRDNGDGLLLKAYPLPKVRWPSLALVAGSVGLLVDLQYYRTSERTLWTPRII